MSEEVKREIEPHDIAFAIAEILAMLDALKPNDNSPRDGRYAVAINDAEHLLAYVDRWIVFCERSKND